MAMHAISPPRARRSCPGILRGRTHRPNAEQMSVRQRRHNRIACKWHVSVCSTVGLGSPATRIRSFASCIGSSRTPATRARFTASAGLRQVSSERLRRSFTSEAASAKFAKYLGLMIGFRKLSDQRLEYRDRARSRPRLQPTGGLAMPARPLAFSGRTGALGTAQGT